MLRTRRTATLAASAAAMVALVACDSSSAVAIKLDGSPRRPDAEGVVEKASADGLTLDGGRTYDVSKKLVAFSTYNRSPIALASTIGNYVQIGLDGKTVVWLGRIGPVSRDDSGHRTAQYQGTLVKVSGSVLTFADGTVLRLAPGLKAPDDPLGPTYAVIDADKRVVQGATFAPKSETPTTRTKN